MTGLPDCRDRADLGRYDPARLHDALGVSRLADKLFPSVVTGARFWPFLFVARDCAGKSDTAIRAALARIAVRHKQDGRLPQRARIGPRTLGSFRPYAGMYRSIVTRAQTQKPLRPLRDFICHRKRHYVGDPTFFLTHQTAWRGKLRASLPAPGKQFARLVWSDGEARTFWDAVQQILKTPSKFHEALVHAASCYALLVCLYGIVEGPGRIVNFADAEQLGALLLSLIRKIPKSPIAQYAPLVRQAIRTKTPPLKEVRRKAQKEQRRVLAGFRFLAFWNLYVRPTPHALS
jgi:hypothetical protein